MIADRHERSLTGRYGRRLQKQLLLPPPVDRASIFGDTYDGVPNPLVAVEHGYPTRYHGPIWTQPQPSYTYAERPYTRAPFLGFEGLGAIGPSVTGNTAADAVIGTLLGYLGAPSKDKALVYAVAGALAGGFGGTLGIIGLLAVELYQAHQKANLRPDLRSA